MGKHKYQCPKPTADIAVAIGPRGFTGPPGPMGATGPQGECVPASSYAIILDESASPITYIGTANPGTFTSEATWQIKRMDETSGLVITFADGNANFDNIWDDRTSLIYS